MKSVQAAIRSVGNKPSGARRPPPPNVARRAPHSLARWLAPLGLVTALAATACSRPATREWTAQDHDVEPTAAGAPTQAAAQKLTAAERGAALIDAAWSNNCASCHGPEGHGDGPTGPMVKAPDLTRADLLDKATDDDLAAVIRTGRGKMPKFDLPPEVVMGLVKRIRIHAAH